MKFSKLLRITTILMGSQLCIFFLVFLISKGIERLFEGDFAIIPLLVLLLVSVLGFVYAFKNYKKGAAIMMIDSVLLGAYFLIVGGLAQWKLGLMFLVPIMIISILIYFSKGIRLKDFA